MGTSPITLGVGNDAQAPGELITAAQRPTPPAQNQPPGAHQAELVICDQAIESFFDRLKQLQRVATRGDKTARDHLAMAEIDCIRTWARFEDAP
jgi:hypothetical protein